MYYLFYMYEKNPLRLGLKEFNFDYTFSRFHNWQTEVYMAYGRNCDIGIVIFTKENC